MSWNVACACWPCASVTVMVTLLVPDWSAAGVSDNVRSMPLPPSVMLPLGSSVVFDEVAVTVRELSGVSASHTANHLPLTAVFRPVEMLGIAVMAGARFDEINSGRKASIAFSRDAYW